MPRNIYIYIWSRSNLLVQLCSALQFSPRVALCQLCASNASLDILHKKKGLFDRRQVNRWKVFVPVSYQELKAIMLLHVLLYYIRQILSMQLTVTLQLTATLQLTVTLQLTATLQLLLPVSPVATQCSSLRVITTHCNALQFTAPYYVRCSKERERQRETNSQLTATHRNLLHLTTSSFFDGYCSTVQGLLDWFEVDLRFTELLLHHVLYCL